MNGKVLTGFLLVDGVSDFRQYAYGRKCSLIEIANEIFPSRFQRSRYQVRCSLQPKRINACWWMC